MNLSFFINCQKIGQKDFKIGKTELKFPIKKPRQMTRLTLFTLHPEGQNLMAQQVAGGL